MKKLKIVCSDWRYDEPESKLATGLVKIDKIEKKGGHHTYRILDFGSVLTILDDDCLDDWKRRFNTAINTIGTKEGYAAIHLDCAMAKAMIEKDGEYNLENEKKLDAFAAQKTLSFVEENANNMPMRIYLQDPEDDTYAWLFDGAQFTTIPLSD